MTTTLCCRLKGGVSDEPRWGEKQASQTNLHAHLQTLMGNHMTIHNSDLTKQCNRLENTLV